MGFSLGGFVNSITGASNSASQANKYAVGNAALNHKYQKEFAQNAHQWEVEDLKKAGLNPALSAGGGGASASGGGSFGGQTGTPGGNPLDIVGNIVGMANQTSATKSQNNLNDAQAMLAMAQAKNIPEELRIKAQHALANMITARANATKAAGSKEGIIGGIVQKGAKGTIKAVTDWFSR